jgi:hypothetical protein
MSECCTSKDRFVSDSYLTRKIISLRTLLGIFVLNLQKVYTIRQLVHAHFLSSSHASAQRYRIYDLLPTFQTEVRSPLLYTVCLNNINVTFKICCLSKLRFHCSQRYSSAY